MARMVPISTVRSRVAMTMVLLMITRVTRKMMPMATNRITRTSTTIWPTMPLASFQPLACSESPALSVAVMIASRAAGRALMSSSTTAACRASPSSMRPSTMHTTRRAWSMTRGS